MATHPTPYRRQYINTLARLEEAVEHQDHGFERYAYSGWGRSRVSQATKNRMLNRSAKSLFVINATARLEVARFMDTQFRAAFASKRDAWFFFVTLTPKEFAVPLNYDPRFDVSELVRWTKRQLGGRDYLGVVEAAYYPNLNVIPGSSGPMVSWHTHVLIWNTTRPSVARIVDTVNGRHLALFPGRSAAHMKPLRFHGAYGKLFYMLKGCLSRYKVFKPRDHVNRETGEVTSSPFKQRKDDIRHGEYARMTEVFRDLRLGNLVFAGGMGRPIRRNALIGAKTKLNQEF